MCALPEEFISLDDYFAREETGEGKHEYHQGVVYALAGASENHNLIMLAAGSSLDTQLDGKPCRPYVSDFRLKVESAGLYTYPDLAVVCGETQLADGRTDTFLNPTVLIEVLSDSTEAYDRGKKAGYYRTIPTLQEYLLIAQDRPHIEHYRRQGSHWVFTEYSVLEDDVPLDAIGCTLSLMTVYRRVRFGAGG